MSPGVFMILIVIPTRRWSSQRLRLQLECRVVCRVLGLSRGQWLQAFLVRQARNIASGTSLLPRLDMLGHVLPLAFCPQTCGLNDFLKTVFIAPIAFGEFGCRPQEQISGQRENWGCRGPGCLGAKLIPPRMPAVSCEQGRASSRLS